MKLALISFIIILLISSFTIGYTISDKTRQTTYPLEQPLELTNKEKPSPSNWIKEKQIHVLNDKIIIDINNPKWAKFTDTNSMDPLFDENSNAIEIIPSSEEDIQAGDIVSYKSNLVEGDIIHRVIEKGRDESGIYFILKGDNNKYKDPEKIRFSQIQRVLIAIIY